MEMGSEETRHSSEHSSMDMYSRVKLRASDGRYDNSAVKSMNVQGKKLRFRDDINSRAIGKKKEGIDSIIKSKELAIGGIVRFAARTPKMASLVVVMERANLISSKVTKGNKGARKRHGNLDSTLDEGNALKTLDAFKKEELKDLGYGYEAGFMIWAKVKSHPWWPGQIFHEALASPSICNKKEEGQVLVAFYGDNTYGWFEPARLIPFDLHYTEKSKQTNTQAFLTAVGEAEDEVKRRAALGLTCCCQNPNNFRPTSVQGSFEVDVRGFEAGGVYSVKQIERARDDFQPSKTLSFVQQLALMPQNNVQRDVEWMKNVAQVLAYRRAVFEEFDETYAQAFGVQPVRPGSSALGFHDPEKAPLQAPLSGQPVITKSLGESKGFEERIKVKDQQMRKKYLSRESAEVNASRVQKLSKAGIYISEKKAPPVSIKPMFLANQDTDGTVGRDFAASSSGSVGKGKEVITMDKNPILAPYGFVHAQVNMGQVDSSAGLSVETLSIEKVKDQPSALKPLKKRFKPDDPAKASSKCQASHHLKGKSMKRAKERKEMKSSATEKKEGNQKPLKVQGDKKMAGSSVSTKPIKGSCMTPEILQGPAEPTMLVMKFPPDSALPSVSELKARFVRFGNLDESATRVFWKSSTCRVVFKNISSAQAAYNHAVLNRNFINNIKVNYHLQALKISAPELPESGASSKRLVEESPDKTSKLRPLIHGDSTSEPGSIALQQLPLRPSVHLKSCLKKLRGDEMKSVNSVQTDARHVEFKLAGNASSREEKMMPSINKTSGSVIGNYLNPVSSSCTTINNNVANFHEVTFPTLPSQLSLPLPSHIPYMHENYSVDHIVNAGNMEYHQVEATNNNSYQNASATTNNIDISQQMLYLLKKCSDIVADLKSSSR